MVFTSLNFFLFFPVVIVIYYILPKIFRWRFLLVISILFYINIKPIFVILLIVVSLITYVFALIIDKENSDKKREQLLFVGIFLILLPLFFFKYYNFVNVSIFSLLEQLGLRWSLPNISLLLPIGISFYTFMAIGYLIDVYNEEIKSEKSFGLVTLFLSFFPLVLSGPIERAPNMIPQFKFPKNLDYQNVAKGLKLMLWGYFMKLVVADRLGIYTDAVYSNFSHHNSTSLLFASTLYPFQVYGDLGGYSLIAIGTARIMGIKVMHNFKRPFCATSMSEFWRRWHISLITWITDYLYTPISFSLRRFKLLGIVLALMVTFLIAGIWHGAAITFIIWGTLQGIILSIEALTKKNKKNIEKRFNLTNKWWYIFFSIIITFVLFASSLFISIVPNIKDVKEIFYIILTKPGNLYIGSPSVLIFGIFSLLLVLIKDFTEEFLPNRFLFFDNNNKTIRVLSYCTIIILILLIGVFDGGQFIYFQF